MTYGLTISQAAAFAGVTVKAVRHYHRLGLVAEPERDRSGYRRYGSSDMVRLVQVRMLAGAGVPLAEVGGLLDADPERFASALDDVERQLTERIVQSRRPIRYPGQPTRISRGRTPTARPGHRVSGGVTQ